MTKWQADLWTWFRAGFTGKKYVCFDCRKYVQNAGLHQRRYPAHDLRHHSQVPEIPTAEAIEASKR